MTGHPYTIEDLRTEAASQHAELAKNPGFMGVGESMDLDIVASTEPGGGRTWFELLPEHSEYNTAQEKIHGLVDGAADISRWAVDLGADGLVPEAAAVTYSSKGKPVVRLHLAFHPDTAPAHRAVLMAQLTQVMALAL
ncbi:hypothetical protein [Streptomyces sp. NPDC051173]|uniref:hypothetical protein n=1 Tax=Streptomyces sp. NPDC051173 TaxID=3155164 RepID=UPI00344E6AEF